MTEEQKFEKFVNDELGHDAYVFCGCDTKGDRNTVAVKAPKGFSNMMCADAYVRVRMKEAKDPTDVDEAISIIEDMKSSLIAALAGIATDDPIKAIAMTLEFALKMKDRNRNER